MKNAINLLLVLALLVTLGGVFASPALAAPRTLYWVEVAGSGTGNWSDINHWSLGSGGAGGEVVPDADDDVNFDVNSFASGAGVVTVDATAYCLDMVWTGATNTPTFAGAGQNILIYGDITAISAMVWNVSFCYLWGGVTSNGLTLSSTLLISSPTANVLLNDNFTCSNLRIGQGSLNTNGKIVNTAVFDDNSNVAAKTVTLGNSVINCTVWSFASGNLTLTANTATIKVTGTGAFAGGGITTYYNVELNGSAHTISGSNTYNNFKLLSGTAQTITFTDGTTQTITNPVDLDWGSTAGNVHTLVGTGIAGWTIASGKGMVNDYLALSYSTAPATGWYAGANSADTVGNSNWVFTAAPATRYWVGDGGNWSNYGAHWSAVSGGLPNATLPTSSDNVYFDGNSFTIGGQTVTVDATAYCLDMDWTGVTNTPTLVHTNQISFYGSVTFIAAMNHTGTTRIVWLGSAVSTFTAGGTLSCDITIYGGGGSLTLQDELNIGSRILALDRLVFITGGNPIICGAVNHLGAEAITVTLGASVINCTSWNYSGTNLTLTANTATINVSGTGAFAGGGIATYHDVNLIGTAHTISGDNTFASLDLDSTIAQTITFTDGSNQTVTDASLSGSAGFLHTLQRSGAGAWTITKAGGGYILCDYLDLSYSTGAPVQTWSYGTHSTIGTAVIDWGISYFYIKVDGVEYGVWAPGASVPDNGNNWTFLENGVMPYMEYHRITVGGTLQQYIVWQYATTFTDQSGKGHDATPSFAVDSSDANITASLLSYGPVAEADAPAYTIGAPPDFITTAPNLTGDFSSTIAPTIPGADVIAAAAASSGTPVQLPWIMISAFVIMAVSITATYVMTRFGSGNSVFVKIVIIIVGMGVLIGTNVFDFWMILYFILPAIAIAWASRPQESLG